jgi:hypothetical protein
VDQPAKIADQPAKKKVYDAPKLVRYGDLVEVTRSLTNTAGALDGVGDMKTA